MNHGTFTGRIGRDSELNRMPNGDAVCNFSIANEIGTKDNPRAQWIECAIFGKRAESLLPYLKKGLKVTVSGRITLETYRNREGVEKAGLRLTVAEIDMNLPPKGEGQAGAQRTHAAPDMPEDDMPF